MVVPLKDFATIKRELQNDISSLIPQASQARNSAILDLFVNPTASQISFLYRSLQQIIESTELNTVSGSDLDKYAANFNITRKPGTLAQGSVFLVLDNSFDQGKDIEINSGQVVTASASNGTTTFRTTNSLFLRREDREVYAAIASANSDRFTQAGILDVTYSVEVPIQATITGNRGLVGSYAITGGNINNVTNIVNLSPTTGGFSAESDQALRQRVALVIAGNSVGTIAGVKSSALSVTGVVSAFIVTPGDPLMTRDGTVFDEDGNIVSEGRGNTIDAYIFGQRLTEATEDYIFRNDSTTTDRISFEENIILGTAESTTSRRQPVVQIGSIIGSESGANFTLASAVTDSEGNTVLEGQVAFIKDFEAGNYTLVRNTTTNQLALATLLNTNSSKYAVVEALESSAVANSVRGEDRLIFLKKSSTITREVLARGGELNGADSLQFSDVIDIASVEQDVKVDRELVKIATDGSFEIQTRHAPIVSVSNVRHVRLGTNFNSTISDASTGKISLVGRFAPQSGDFLEVSYVWRKNYLRSFEYFLQEDSINWIQPEFIIENDSLTIYNGNLSTTVQPRYQPLTPTFLALSVSNAVKRAQYDLSVVGDISDIYEDFTTSYARGLGESVNDSDALVFNNNLFARQDAVDSHIGRVTRVRNLTRGFDYNLIGYKLQTNRYAPEAGVNTNLSSTQFSLSEQNNLTRFAINDIVRFNAPKSNANWSSAEELLNNIKSNILPVYDQTKITIDQTLSEIQLVQPEENENLADSVADTSIVTDTTWSGNVRVDDDVTIAEDVTLTIQPGTVVSVVSSGDLPSVQEVIQNVQLVRTNQPLVSATPPTSYENLYYIFFNNAAPFFVVLSDDGLEEQFINFNTDVISKEKTNVGQTVYKINGFDIESKFWNSLQSAINKNGTLVSALVEKAVGAGTQQVYVSYDVVRFGTEVFIVPLENDPRELSTTVYDVLLRNENNSNEIVTVEYDPSFGKYVIIPKTTSTTKDWNLEYGVSVTRRLTITVNGTLIADSSSAETPIIFTSFATEKTAGDWGGLIFNPSSSSLEAGTQSVLRNCWIKYANNSIQNLSSDPLIEDCIIKDYLSSGGVSLSEPQLFDKYTTESFLLTNTMFVLNAPQRVRKLGTENIPSTFDVVTTTTPASYGQCGYGYGYGDCGYGYGDCTGTPLTPEAIISGAYVSFNLPVHVLTAPVGGSGSEGIPAAIQVQNNRAVLNLSYGTDYIIYLGNEDITSKAIQTFADCSDVTLIAGVDFNIEMDTLTSQTQIVFYNTRNMLAFLYLYAKEARQFSITFYGVFSNGTVTNSLFYSSSNPAWIAQSGSDLTLTNNTVYNTGPVAFRIANSYMTLRNNIVAEYTAAPVVKDSGSLTFVKNNNMYSSIILANEPHRPVDTDSLTDDFEIDEIVLPVRSPVKYQSGLILKIDDEFIEIEQVGLEVRVKRAALESTAARHTLGSRVLILRKKTFFTITGLPGTNAQLVLTDSKGSALSTSSPVTMIQVETSTFRIAIPVDRQNTVFYRYRYWNDDPTNYSQTEVRKLETAQFGDAVNDFFSVGFSEGVAIKNNYSADPKFVNELGENFSLQTTSPSNFNNPIYSTPWDPSVSVNKFLGAIPRSESVFLAENTKVITLGNSLLVANSLAESITIRNQTSGRRVLPSSYNPETNEITLLSPITLKTTGNYTIEYNSPISLGTSLVGNPIVGTIQYQFDAKRSVQFLSFKTTTGGAGGLIRFAYRASERKDTIQNQDFSDYLMVGSDGILNLEGQSITGSIIEFIIEINGNDGSWDNSGIYLYPKLQGFTLTYAPSVDEQSYEVKEVRYLPVSERTRITLDPPNQTGVGILGSTATSLSGVSEVAVNIQKQGVGEFIQIAKVRSLNSGDKYVDLLGNFTVAKTAPAIGETVAVDLSYVSRGSTEVVTFVNSSNQITTNRFVGISSINTDIVLDRVSQAAGNEKLKVDITNQPPPGAGYNVTYDFEAPKDGETLSVSFTYNSLLQDVQSALDTNKDALADVLAREMFGTEVAIAANVVIEAGFNPQEVVANITRAISQQFTNFVAENPFGGGRIDLTDTLTTIKNVDGVDDLTITEHHKKGFTGRTNIQFTTREFPVFDSTSPQITLVSQSDPNTVLSVTTNG